MHDVTFQRVTMHFERNTRAPRLPENDDRAGKPSNVRGDGFAGGCISLIVLLIEIPVALLLGLTSVIHGWGGADERTAVPAMDWVPVLWFGGFTIGVLVIALLFLYSAHPFAGAVQLLLAAIALFFTITVWQDQYERAQPSPLPRTSGCRTLSAGVFGGRETPAGNCPQGYMSSIEG
ncbi:DUF6234 family protein [Streptomyces sp. NPDC048438]|uniref:DUF6234 family protein n=1 Tax=Streptomyces sp. NPDC048438 TaxID=3365551 RepID=UPI00371EE8BE